MTENIISKEIKDELIQMDFETLRQLIESCLTRENKEKTKINSDFFTIDSVLLTEYTNILETKILPPTKPSFPNFFLDLKIQILTNIHKRLSDELRKKYLLLEADEKKGIKQNINKYNQTINELKKIILKYEIEIKNREKQNTRPRKVSTIESLRVEEYESKLKIHKDNLKAISEIRENILKINDLDLQLTRLNWKLFPKGEINFCRLRDYLERYSNIYTQEYDFEKIEKILSLNVDRVYCGIDEFEGYLVFYFQDTETAILDCPKKGNAIYILGEDWEKLSCLSKSELINYHTAKTVRIIHRGAWFERLKVSLRKRSST